MKLYKNTTLNPLTVEGNTAHDKANALWHSPSFDRYAVMSKVHPFKSIALRYRACINYIAENMI
jgi:hypothetical protein